MYKSRGLLPRLFVLFDILTIQNYSDIISMKMIIRKGEQMAIYNFYLKEHITGESELLLASCTEREAMIEMGIILENNHNNGYDF